MKVFQKLVIFFFLAFLLSLPTGQVFRVQLPFNIAFTATDILLGITVFLWLCLHSIVRKKHTFQYTPYILGFIGIAIISLLVNVTHLTSAQLSVSLLYPLRWLLYACLYFIVSPFPKNEKKIIHKLLLFVGSAIVVFGFLQYLLYQNLRNLYYLGWDDHLYRLFSSFLDPNFTGLFLVLFLIYLFYRIQLEEKRKQQIPLLILAISTLVSIILTYSRTALLSLILISIWYVLWKKQYEVLIGILILGILLFLVLSRGFSKENTNLLRTASSFARVESLKNAGYIFSKNPILGIGFNAYRYAQVRYGFRHDTTFSPNHADAGTDNSFLFVLATTGVIGFGVYMLLWSQIVKQVWREQYVKEKTTSIFATSIFLSILAVFLGSLFINALFYPSIMAWVWILIGLTENT